MDNPFNDFIAEYELEDRFQKFLVKTDVIKYIERYYQNKYPDNLFISGPRGCGKSTALRWLDGYLTKRGELTIRIHSPFYFYTPTLSGDVFLLIDIIGEMIRKKLLQSEFEVKLDEITHKIKKLLIDGKNINEIQPDVIELFKSSLIELSKIHSSVYLLIDEIEKYPTNTFKLYNYEELEKDYEHIQLLQNEKINIFIISAARKGMSEDINLIFSLINGRAPLIYNLEWDIGYITELIRKSIEIITKQKLSDYFNDDSIILLNKMGDSNPIQVKMYLHRWWAQYKNGSGGHFSSLQKCINETDKQYRIQSDQENRNAFTIEYKKNWEQVINSKTNKEKGKSLENLIIFLFTSLKGITLLDREIRTNSAEIDIMLKNTSEDSFLKLLGTPILIECKNESISMSSRDVSWTITQVENRDLKFGIIVAMEGLTGNKYKDAISHLKTALTHGIKIIVLNRDDLASIYSPDDLYRKLEEKYYSIYKI